MRSQLSGETADIMTSLCAKTTNGTTLFESVGTVRRVSQTTLPVINARANNLVWLAVVGGAPCKLQYTSSSSSISSLFNGEKRFKL